MLPEALPAETTYQLRLTCKEASIAHIRALLLATISRLPITLQALHEEDDVETGAASLRAEIRTAGRDTEAIEQVVMRISIEDDVSALSWSISESLMD